jgi:DNA-binding transcriptional LysR family regulator
MAQHVPKARVALRFENTWAVRDAVDAGVGVALLPCATGDARPGWRRVRLVPEVGAPLWILTHRDLRATARVRVLSEVLWQSISAERALYEGRYRPRVSAGARR